MGDEVDSLLADKLKSFLQVDSVSLGVFSQACPNYPKQQVKQPKTHKYKSFLQIDTMILMGMVKHSQTCQITNLQCVYNISKQS